MLVYMTSTLQFANKKKCNHIQITAKHCMPIYAMKKNKHLTSLKTTGLRLLVHVQGKSNLETSGNAFSAKLSFLETLEIC